MSDPASTFVTGRQNVRQQAMDRLGTASKTKPEHKDDKTSIIKLISAPPLITSRFKKANEKESEQDKASKKASKNKAGKSTKRANKKESVPETDDYETDSLENEMLSALLAEGDEEGDGGGGGGGGDGAGNASLQNKTEHTGWYITSKKMAEETTEVKELVREVMREFDRIVTSPDNSFQMEKKNILAKDYTIKNKRYINLNDKFIVHPTPDLYRLAEELKYPVMQNFDASKLPLEKQYYTTIEFRLIDMGGEYLQQKK